MSIDSLSASTSNLGGVVQEYLWSWENQKISVVYESLGKGSTLLLLPAFSTVSMRSEMSEIGKLLSPTFELSQSIYRR